MSADGHLAQSTMQSMQPALAYGPAASSARSEPASHRGWIHSPAFDLALFTLAPIAGLLVLWANANMRGGIWIMTGALYFVAIPHYLASFTFFLGDDNREYYRSRRVAFYAGPVVIFGLVILLRLIGMHGIVQSTMYTWNVWHVSLQSAGILSIYRRLNGGAPTERTPAHLAILGVSATMAFWYIDRFPPLFDMLVRLHPLAPWALRAATLPLAAGALAVLVVRLARRPGRLGLSEMAFLVTSLLLFHPFLWVRDSNLATFGMLMGHFIQYLAIVWLVHHRKYGSAAGSAPQRWLGQVTSRPALLFGTVAGSGLVFYAANKISEIIGAPMAYIIVWNALTLVHFYLDGLIWAFRQPFVRRSMGPYLTPDSHAVLS